jgi:glycosyltransferase involved in cell wall biosynthesis
VDELFPSELKARLSQIGDADIVVGIPSYNNARTIGHVVRAVSVGLAKYFPAHRSVIVNSDGGSKDKTQDVVMRAEGGADDLLLVSHPVHNSYRISTPYHGIPGKGSAFRTIFAVAAKLNAKACVVVDSDLRSITPGWVELLAKPVLEQDYDYIAPYYQRHKYDGTITNGIIYPMTRTLYGKSVRQPIGGEFGFSGNLAKRYLEKDVWDTDVARFGIDIWMTVTAIAEGFRVGQAYLGAKIHDAKDPGADLTSMFRQVVGSFFSLMGSYEHVWKKVSAYEAIPMFGFPFEVGVEPLTVNTDRMIHAAQQGVADLREIYSSFLSPQVLVELTNFVHRNGQGFHMPDQLWVRMIYEAATAFRYRLLDREHLLQSLVPLYLGRTASFVLEVTESNATQVEERIERLGQVFEAEKPYLTQQWDAIGKEKFHAQPV